VGDPDTSTSAFISGTVYSNFDGTNMGYTAGYVDTVDHCYSLCEANTDCKSFTFARRYGRDLV
jgi:hypothetical protein